ncbi:MAG: hypothetical protein C5B58_05290 [Acidobacteria bacterium]|nr:MAG: hypothetical protein C5B58_05290 [Acidobacteriota bacterium]
MFNTICGHTRAGGNSARSKGTCQSGSPPGAGSRELPSALVLGAEGAISVFVFLLNSAYCSHANEGF